MEGRPSRGRGGYPRRGGGGAPDAAGPGEYRGRGRGGHHRGRGKRDHYRGRGRGGPPADFRRGQAEENDNEDSGDDVPAVFSRRKLESNWDRYEASEKEEQKEEDMPTQRGTDYHVLLSSAGDSFTQFRLSEEKDWEMDSLAANQMSAIFLDLPALAQVLQELPLHKRLNLESELVQLKTPVELPSVGMFAKTDADAKVGFKLSAPGEKGPGSSQGLSCSVKPVPSATSTHVATSTAPPPMENRDDELDLLLNLQKPVSEAPPTIIAAEKETNEGPLEEVEEDEEDTVEGKVLEVASTESVRQEVTEEDLEDWLDSMIS